MKRKIELLPHWCQTAGFVTVGISVLAGIILGAAGLTYPWIMAAGRLVIATSLAIAALSKETQEDEMIRDIRLKSVAAAGLIFLLEYIVYALMEAIAPGSDLFGGYFTTRAKADILDITLIYLLIFKVQVISGRKEL